jgi:hypothetical protein
MRSPDRDSIAAPTTSTLAGDPETALEAERLGYDLQLTFEEKEDLWSLLNGLSQHYAPQRSYEAVKDIYESLPTYDRTQMPLADCDEDSVDEVASSDVSELVVDLMIQASNQKVTETCDPCDVALPASASSEIVDMGVEDCVDTLASLAVEGQPRPRPQSESEQHPRKRRERGPSRNSSAEAATCNGRRNENMVTTTRGMSLTIFPWALVEVFTTCRPLQDPHHLLARRHCLR